MRCCNEVFRIGVFLICGNIVFCYWYASLVLFYLRKLGIISLVLFGRSISIMDSFVFVDAFALFLIFYF